MYMYVVAVGPKALESCRVSLLNMTSSLTHAQRVLRLYKKSARHLESWITHRPTFRYEVTLLRARFDEHKNETDMKKAAQLLRDGEEEFWEKQHPQPYIFIDSPGGTRYERNIPSPEWVLNYWHPSEKARYPAYFARREKRIAQEQARWQQLVDEEKQMLGQGADQGKPQST
ncbi:NADH dehydrogenase [ubiquinone] 1 beta subcomplex subunit 9-like [Acanthaster planci]|uniref:NADH dehydrogenase [ubiquinone] 1 beta subcomplex subunit 9 n=1 Tax=Acanthaster planci TaxID=133434 RepID=A0A8B7YT56_ACAPL|nr:NADH dehydrogenase [ubiquinone] 1 beta subcomplex subunit 9-like [Acanthaster planci]